MIKNVVIVVLLVITFVSVIYGITQGIEAQKQRDEAVAARTNSLMARELAEIQRTLAEANVAMADSVVQVIVEERDGYAQLVNCIAEEYNIRDDKLNELANNCE